MAVITIGRIIPDFKGDWDSNETYSKLDIVCFKSSSYVATRDVTNGLNPEQDDISWQLVAEKGRWNNLSEEEKANIISQLQPTLNALANGLVKDEENARKNADKIINNRLESIEKDILNTVDIQVTDKADLDLADDNGNVIMRLNNGHIKTKNFDSANLDNTIKDKVGELDGKITQAVNKVNQLDNTLSDLNNIKDIYIQDYKGTILDIADEAGNVVFRLDNNGITTKSFKSQDLDIFRATKLNKPHCICHGYGAATGKANTMPYFLDGVQKGFEWFECDSVLTKDNVPVCTHIESQYVVKNKISGQIEYINISNINYQDLINTYTWDDGTPFLRTDDLIYYICYIKRFPLWVDGQGLNDTARKALSNYACELGVGEYVFHESNKVFLDVPISNALPSATTVAEMKSLGSLKLPNNNIIFNLGQQSYTNDELKLLAKTAKSMGCYTAVWTYRKVEDIRNFMLCGIDFIITAGVTNNEI